MLHLFSFHLLGVWLLLSCASGMVPPGWLDEVIKLCGRELVRAKIDICGKVLLEAMDLGQEEERLQGRGPSAAETTLPSPNKDVDSLNTLEFIPSLPQELKTTLSERQPTSAQLQYIPALKRSNVGFQELKKIIHNKRDEAEDNSPAVYLGLNTRSPKKRQFHSAMSAKCCHVGCTRRSIAKSC